MTAMLAGRADELRAGRMALDATFAGAGQLLLLTGEPGIGKSALLDAIAGEAAARGALVLSAVCWDEPGAPAYWPWIQLLRRAQAAVPGVGVGDAAALLDRSVALPAGGGSDAADARFRLAEAVVGSLTELAARGPLVLTIDDLQWADEQSLRLVDFVAAHLRFAPVLLLGAYRDTELEHPPSWRGELLPLSGLAAADIAALMTGVSGDRPPPEVVAQVAARSGGNPFFVRELTRLLMLQQDAGGVPPATVRDAVERRLARLPTSCVEVITVASVAGPRVRPELLALVVRAGTDLEAELAAAVQARIIIQSGAGLSFAHDLFRETAAAGIPTAQRADLHARIGGALQRLAASGAHVGPGEIAAHLVAAHPSAPDDIRTAVRFCELAAAAAQARYGHAEAADHLAAAVRLTGVGPADGTDRIRLVADLAAAQDRAGRTGAARDEYHRLAVLAREVGSADLLARAALGLHALGARTESDFSESRALLTEAEAAQPAEAVGIRSTLLAAHVRDRVHSGWTTRDKVAAAADVAERALDLAQRSGDPSALAGALLGVHDVRWWPGSATDRLPVVEQMLAAARQAGDAELVAEAMVLRATARLELGDPRGTADLEEYGRLCTQLGHARGRHQALTRRATAALIAGDIESAVALADQGLALGIAMGAPEAVPCHLTLRTSAAAMGGPPVGLSTDAVRDDPIREQMPLLDALLAVFAGRTGAAQEAFAGWPMSALPDVRDLEFPALAALAATAVGTEQQRRECYDRLAPYAGTHVVVGGCASYTGPVDYHLGTLATALGEHEVAVGHLHAAEAAAGRLGAVAWAARAASALTGLDAEPGSRPLLRRENTVWRIAFHGREVHLPDSKGLRDLAVLLSRPGTDVPATALLGGAGPVPGADPVLDDQARAAYRQRIAELEAELDAADIRGDARASERARDERAVLIAELASATGLGGRARRLGDEAERARKAVTARIRSAIRQIEDVHPALGAHLAASVLTGSTCRYAPAEPVGREV